MDIVGGKDGLRGLGDSMTVLGGAPFPSCPAYEL